MNVRKWSDSVTDVQKQSEVFGDFSSAVPDSADAHIFEEETAIDSRRKTAEAYAASSYPSKYFLFIFTFSSFKAMIYACSYNCGEPPVTPYIGVSQRMCHLVRTKRHLCCLEMTTVSRSFNWIFTFVTDSLFQIMTLCIYSRHNCSHCK